MGLFSRIADRILGRRPVAATQKAPAPAAPAAPDVIMYTGSENDPKVAPPPRTPEPAQQAAEPVDVEAVLAALAEEKGGKSDWRRSIVDLLKLLDLDSSLDARRELAEELGVSAGAHGSAEQNIALHKAVMRKLADNGGKVPEDLKD